MSLVLFQREKHMSIQVSPRKLEKAFRKPNIIDYYRKKVQTESKKGEIRNDAKKSQSSKMFYFI
jgi:hypothetical protein